MVKVGLARRLPTWRRVATPVGIVAAVVVVLLVAAGFRLISGFGGGHDIVVGIPSTTSTPTTGPRVILPPSTQAPVKAPPVTIDEEARAFSLGSPQPEPGAAAGLAAADGQPWAPAIAFTTSQKVPSGLVFVLVVGSDARPGEDLRKTRSDSIHLAAINPQTRQGTLLGFPRDSYVEIPKHGRGKINDALALGGPDLLAATIRNLTGLPVDYYVLTGFTGFAAMVDELHGVDVKVDRRMNDAFSGARFQPGWHHFSGNQALAFSRDRHDVAYGDFTRSEHQGLVLVSALAKLRAEVGDDGGLAHWTSVFLRHGQLDVPLTRLPELAALARRIDPSRITNTVVPGKVGTARGASVVYLTKEAAAMFTDLRDDAVLGTVSAPPEDTTTSTTAPATTTTTTTSVAPATTTPTVPPITQAPTSTTTSTTAPGGSGGVGTTTSTTRPAATTSTTTRPGGP